MNHPTSPTKLTIRAYPVGFGDCFLLTWTYAGSGHRHVLIDFGSTSLPDGAKTRMMDVAHDIASVCEGKLHVVVATHRHADHISGFATKKNGKGTGDIIRSLKPDLVVQPWTEDPNAKPNATSPASPAPQRAMAALLESMHAVAERAHEESERLPPALGATARKLRFLGRDNIKNLSAVENLMTMGQESVYASFGTVLPSVLPGVTVHVLGPPTLEQSERIRTMRAKDADEFWHLQAATVSSAAWEGETLFPRELAGCEQSKEVRWFCSHLAETRAQQLLEIVRALDAQMNNTSLILLFEAGGKRYLFPGDAQIENWSFALEDERVQALLTNVDLYKVGHHGSLNATPKTLWSLFEKRGAATKPDRLQTLMSTKPGKHGSVARKTEVPRTKLVRALRKDSKLTTTQRLNGAEPAILEFDL